MDIIIGLQARDRLSVGENRKRLGHSAFHWSVIVHDSTTWHHFDVTDGIVQEPVTFIDLNPERNWIYRHLQTESISQITRWLLGVRIAQIPNGGKGFLERMEKMCQNLNLPEKNKRPGQNCLSWVVATIMTMQTADICRRFEMDPFLDFAVHLADERIVDYQTTSDLVWYPPCAPSKGERKSLWKRWFWFTGNSPAS